MNLEHMALSERGHRSRTWCESTDSKCPGQANPPGQKAEALLSGGAGVGTVLGVAASGYRLIWGCENILKLDRGNGCRALRIHENY